MLDLHNYIAWDPKAKEFEEIESLEQQRGLLEQMSSWALVLRTGGFPTKIRVTLILGSL